MWGFGGLASRFLIGILEKLRKARTLLETYGRVWHSLKKYFRCDV